MLATSGYGSRRACEELIADGRVTVNGEVAVLGRRVDVERDRIEVDGVPVAARPGLVHYLLNKPRGVVTTVRDPHGRPTVVDLVPAEPRVFPVGRLDADTEGLLLLTNDGELAHRLTHPSFGVEKEYLAEVARRLDPGAVRRLREGVELDDGLTAPAEVAAGAGTAAPHDPRGPQPPGPAHVRRGRPSGAAARAGADRPARATSAWRPARGAP